MIIFWVSGPGRLYNRAANDPAAWRAGLEGFFDADGFLRWLAANAVMQNWDVYGNAPHNYYLYGDPGDDARLHWIPWDHNETFKDGGGVKQPLPLDMASVGDDWPLIRYLLDDEGYRLKYKAYLLQFVQDVFIPDAMILQYSMYYDMLKEYAYGEEPPYTFLGSDGTDVSYRTAAQVMASLSEEAGAAFSFNNQQITNVLMQNVADDAAKTALTAAIGMFVYQVDDACMYVCTEGE